MSRCGRLRLRRKKINISTVLTGQKLGIKEVDEGIWLVGFIHYDLGYFDLEQKNLQPLDDPFGTRLSPMSQVRSVTHVSGPDNLAHGSGGALPPFPTPTKPTISYSKLRMMRALRQEFKNPAVINASDPIHFEVRLNHLTHPIQAERRRQR